MASRSSCSTILAHQSAEATAAATLVLQETTIAAEDPADTIETIVLTLDEMIETATETMAEEETTMIEETETEMTMIVGTVDETEIDLALAHHQEENEPLHHLAQAETIVLARLLQPPQDQAERIDSLVSN